MLAVLVGFVRQQPALATRVFLVLVLAVGFFECVLSSLQAAAYILLPAARSQSIEAMEGEWQRYGLSLRRSL
jgi:hypothetical protein